MNKVILMGRLTRDPEVRYSSGDTSTAIARYSLAVDRRFSRNNEENNTDFINIVVWRGQAENCHKYLKKGSKCGIVGTLQTRSYDAQDGSKRYVTEVVADEVEFISTNRNQDGTSREDAPAEDVTELKPIDDDSLPF